MAEIKSFTSLGQSKKLVEILPLESADMCFNISQRNNMPPLMTPYSKFNEFFDMEKTPDFLIPCWSLAALLDVLDDIVVDDEGNEYSLTILKEEGMYYIYYHNRWGEVNDIETNCYYDLIDACYEMILKLYELKLL